jgi:hypothetical protein
MCGASTHRHNCVRDGGGVGGRGSSICRGHFHTIRTVVGEDAAVAAVTADSMIARDC